MSCPICGAAMVKPQGHGENFTISSEGIEYDPLEGMVCTDTDCKASATCGVCGHGWTAVECDPQIDWEKTVGSMGQHIRPGDCFLVCPNGHRECYHHATPGPSQMDVLMRRSGP